MYALVCLCVCFLLLIHLCAGLGHCEAGESDSDPRWRQQTLQQPGSEARVPRKPRVRQSVRGWRRGRQLSYFKFTVRNVTTFWSKPPNMIFFSCLSQLLHHWQLNISSFLMEYLSYPWALPPVIKAGKKISRSSHLTPHFTGFIPFKTQTLFRTKISTSANTFQFSKCLFYKLMYCKFKYKLSWISMFFMNTFI